MAATRPCRSGSRTASTIPLSLYAATKKADELMSESYAHLFRLPMTGLRFFTVYGPWGRPDMAMWIFTKALFEGEPLPLFNDGDMRRDFTYIDDIVRGVVACLDGPPADDGAVKAGGSTAPARALQYRQPPQRRSDADGRAARAGDRARRRCSTPQPMQPGDVKDTFADISAIERDHGFEPTTSIDEGVPRFVDWYQATITDRLRSSMPVPPILSTGCACRSSARRCSSSPTPTWSSPSARPASSAASRR